MEAYVLQVYSSMILSHRCSVDSILENPKLREEYLLNMRQRTGDIPEEMLLHALTNMRKRSKLPRFRDLAKPSPTPDYTLFHSP